MLAGSYNKKFRLIIDHEYAMAKSVALSLIKPKPLTVWDLMIPVIFILNFIKLKQSREVFIQNQIFTNTLALEATRDMFKRSQSRQDVFDTIEKKTRDLVSSVPDGIYSEEIRREQLTEIDFLMDHYGKLFEAEGDDYAILVKNAYVSRANYAAFLSQLSTIEKDVMMAAQRTLGAQADLQAARRLEELTEKVRVAEIEKIFPMDLSQQNVN
ncbi:MAG: NF038143 family protein [Desulfobacteraceae bacterium]|jgi:hypothetical protein